MEQWSSLWFKILGEQEGLVRRRGPEAGTLEAAEMEERSVLGFEDLVMGEPLLGEQQYVVLQF